MRISTYVYAGQHERFAEDVKLPEAGQEMKVTLFDGTRTTGTLVSAERVDGERIQITVEVDADAL